MPQVWRTDAVSEPLTDQDVLDIRQWWADGGTRAEMADSYGVAGQTIYAIVTRIYYRRLPGGRMYLQLQLPGFCRNGHVRRSTNIYIEPGTGVKECRLCRAIAAAKGNAKRKAARQERIRKYGRSPFDPTKRKVSNNSRNTVRVWLPGIWVQGRLF